jgi:hypothetical protein
MAEFSIINSDNNVFRQRPVVSISSTQPSSPAAGAMYILGASPTGAVWSTCAEDDILLWTGSDWERTAPVFPMVVYAMSYRSLYHYDGTEWSAL